MKTNAMSPQDIDRMNLFQRFAHSIKGLFRHRRILIGTGVILFFLACAVLAPFISPYDPLKMDLRAIYKPPSAKHFLGTDSVGRDILSRLIWGTRISLTTAACSVSIGLMLGISLGTTAGYFGGWVDMLISRLIDIMLSLPSFIIAIALMGSLGRGITNMIIAIGLAQTPRIARVVRSAALTVKENQFVEAAHSFGYGELRIIFTHIIPHTLTPVVVYATLILGSSVMIEAGLSFLGLGISPPTPSWGVMVSAGALVLRDLPWYATSAGLLIMLLVLGFNTLGDGLRDKLDPKLATREAD